MSDVDLRYEATQLRQLIKVLQKQGDGSKIENIISRIDQIEDPMRARPLYKHFP